MLTATEIAGGGIKIADVVAEIASIGVKAGDSQVASWVARTMARIIPGGGVILSAIELALPIIDQIAKGAPQMSAAIKEGMPVAAAIDQVAPNVMQHIRALAAIAINHDPERAEAALAPQQVSDSDVRRIGAWALIGRPMTQAEENAWMDRFSVGAS